MRSATLSERRCDRLTRIAAMALVTTLIATPIESSASHLVGTSHGQIESLVVMAEPGALNRVETAIGELGGRVTRPLGIIRRIRGRRSTNSRRCPRIRSGGPLGIT